MTRASSERCSLDDRPERSRNAKAQARHRAKRKAYIEQLEQTVTKLQTVLALSPDQVAALPPPVIRIRELEQENEVLHREIDELRQQLEQRNAQLRPDLGRRDWIDDDSRRVERDIRRRRTVDTGDIYLQHPVDARSRSPPSLFIPPQGYNQNSSHSLSYSRSQPPALLPSYGMNYQMPGTPSCSSTSSSSPFSPADYTSSHSQRSAPSPVLSHYSHLPPQYEVVKLEEDNYASRHNIPHANGYGVSVPSFPSSQPGLDHWHTYSSERA